MKIQQLITELKKYNPDADITLLTTEDITLSYVCEDRNGNDLTPKTTKQVFIEGCDWVDGD